jgi:hypothetical protein
MSFQRCRTSLAQVVNTNGLCSRILDSEDTVEAFLVTSKACRASMITRWIFVRGSVDITTGVRADALGVPKEISLENDGSTVTTGSK